MIPILVHENDYSLQMRQDGIQSVYVRMNGMWLVFANERTSYGIWEGINAIWYTFGIHKSLKNIHIKNGIQAATWIFGWWEVY